MSAKETYWCNNCNVPLLSEKCDFCRAEGILFTNRIKPIFQEELEFYQKQIPQFSETTQNFSLLFHGRNYLYSHPDRKFRISIKYNEKSKPKLIINNKNSSNAQFKKILDYIPGKNTKNNKAKLIQNWDGTTEYEQRIILANKSALAELESEALEFIEKTLMDYPESKYELMVSFSGGKDSSVVAYLVKKVLKEKTKEIPLVFSNTSIELDETIDFFHNFSTKYQFKDVELKPVKTFFENCEILGPPSRMMRWCCSTQKSMPINTFQGKYKKKILSFDGIRRDESNLRRNYPRIKRNTKVTKQISAYPIIDWTDLQVWLYILWRKIPFNRAYRYGYSRVGCWTCPNNTQFDWKLSENFIPQFAKWQKILKEFAENNGKDETWINSGKWKSRRVHYNFDKGIKKYHPCLQGNDIFYTLDKEIPNIGEYLKIFGKHDEKFDIEGKSKITGKYCEIIYSENAKFLQVKFNPKQLPKHYKYQVEKQITKATNCVSCGACVGVCPSRAISFNPGFSIDSSKCTGCLICTTSKYLGASCVALHYKTDQVQIQNNFRYNHPVPGDFYKHAFRFSKKLYEKLLELKLINVDEFLQKDLEFLTEKTGLTERKILENKKIAQAHKKAKIIPFSEKSTKQLQNVFEKDILFIDFKFNENREKISKISFLDCHVDPEKFNEISGNENDIISKFKMNLTQNSVLVYFSTRIKERRKIKSLLIDDLGLSKKNYFDFYNFLIHNFALPLKRSGNHRFENLIKIVEDNSDFKISNLDENPYKVQKIFNYLLGFSHA